MLNYKIMIKYFPLSILLLLIVSCNEIKVEQPIALEDESIFPKVKKITELKNTDFSPTLESTFNPKKNSIYGATIPFVWEEIRNEIGPNLSSFTSNQLNEINESESFKDVLNKNEYKTTLEIEGNLISATAYFRKSLPFEIPFDKFEIPLEFENTKVESFGFFGDHYYSKLNYYNNEDDFSLSLLPSDSEHEIILIMNKDISTNESNFISYYTYFLNQKKNNIEFNEEDKVEIPIIEFNLEKYFNEIIGSQFLSDNELYNIKDFYQRNAFILNEKGAEVESEAVAAVEALEEMEIIEKPEPKMLIFNKPFVVFLKRKDANNPYFGVYIANNELLKIVK